MDGTSKDKVRYDPIERYRKVLRPERDANLNYDDPEEFGKSLAQKHIKMLHFELQKVRSVES